MRLIAFFVFLLIGSALSVSHAQTGTSSHKNFNYRFNPNGTLSLSPNSSFNVSSGSWKHDGGGKYSKSLTLTSKQPKTRIAPAIPIVVGLVARAGISRAGQAGGMTATRYYAGLMLNQQLGRQALMGIIALSVPLTIYTVNSAGVIVKSELQIPDGDQGPFERAFNALNNSYPLWNPGNFAWFKVSCCTLVEKNGAFYYQGLFAYHNIEPTEQEAISNNNGVGGPSTVEERVHTSLTPEMFEKPATLPEVMSIINAIPNESFPSVLNELDDWLNIPEGIRDIKGSVTYGPEVTKTDVQQNPDGSSTTTKTQTTTKHDYDAQVAVNAPVVGV